ncbi:MAG TPA: polysaccharide biosynthesis tyrosine autokinase [Verrucomicrobiae bacterium]|nr:polysaccharide biosynthesis tyrosine autokinase [Verrucomicrobiae bacterium]
MDPITPPAAPESRLHFLDYWRVIKTRKVIVFLVFLLVVLTVFTLTLFKPKIYMASTRIKVEQERPSVEVFQPTIVPSYDPYFLRTQYEIIQSQKILYPVIERLGLQKIWGGDTPLPMEIAFAVLKGELIVRPYRDTSLIEIDVQSPDGRQAAAIANTIAEVFESDRLEVKRQQTQKGLDKLRDEAAQQEERLHRAQEKVEKLRRELDVPVINNAKLTDQTLSQLEQRLTAARDDLVTREVSLKEINKLSLRELRNTINTLIQDTTVQTLLQNLTDIDTKLEAMKEDYGPDHPAVRQAMATRDKLEQQLDERLDGIKRAYAINYQVAKVRVEELQKQFDDAKNANLVVESEQYLPFTNAQREEDLEERLYEAVKSRIQQASIEMQVPRSPVEVIDRAEVPLPQAYVSPKMWLNVSIGAVLGLLLGVALTFFIEFLDTSVKKVEDVEHYLRLPVLGVVGQQASLLNSAEFSAVHLEAYRMLRTNIEFAKPPSAITSLCVLSAGAGEGKSFTIANLAYVYAQQGGRVLVVDSDLRRPGVHRYLGASDDFGLADYLSGTKTVQEVIQSTSTPNVSVIASGTGSTVREALPLLTSRRMAELIDLVSQQFDVILYDTPPILGVSDAAIIAREVGLALLVIQHRRYPRNMAQRAVQVIQNAGGKLLGAVVNSVQIGQDETYYYYHDQLEHYQQRPARKTQPVVAESVAAPKPRKSDGDGFDLSGKY